MAIQCPANGMGNWRDINMALSMYVLHLFFIEFHRYVSDESAFYTPIFLLATILRKHGFLSLWFPSSGSCPQPPDDFKAMQSIIKIARSTRSLDVWYKARLPLTGVTFMRGIPRVMRSGTWKIESTSIRALTSRSMAAECLIQLARHKISSRLCMSFAGANIWRTQKFTERRKSPIKDFLEGTAALWSRAKGARWVFNRNKDSHQALVRHWGCCCRQFLCGWPYTSGSLAQELKQVTNKYPDQLCKINRIIRDAIQNASYC